MVTAPPPVDISTAEGVVEETGWVVGGSVTGGSVTGGSVVGGSVVGGLVTGGFVTNAERCAQHTSGLRR